MDGKDINPIQINESIRMELELQNIIPIPLKDKLLQRNSDVWYKTLRFNSGEFIKVFGNTDLLVQVDSKLPTARTHFFGIGNNTTFDKGHGHGYYLAHYDLSSISAILRDPVNSWLQIKYGPLFQTFKLSEKGNGDKYISSLQK